MIQKNKNTENTISPESVKRMRNLKTILANDITLVITQNKKITINEITIVLADLINNYNRYELNFLENQVFKNG